MIITKEKINVEIIFPNVIENSIKAEAKIYKEDTFE